MPGGALTLALLAVQPPIPPPSPFQDLLSELAGKIAAAVAPVTRIHLMAPGVQDADAPPPLESDLAERLATLGLKVVGGGEGTATVLFTCAQNIRQRVCTADVRKGEVRTVVMAERWQDAGRGSGIGVPIVINLQPVIAQDAPILDVAAAGSRLAVLDPTALSLYERVANGWRAVAASPITSSRPWPRDVRGRVRIDGGAVEAFLPGVTCHGRLEPLSVACAGDQRPWPIAIDNMGIAPGRNHFTIPDAPAFFTAAALAPAAGARWMLASQDGRLVFLDAARRTVDSIESPGDNVAAVTTTCEAGSHVLVSLRANEAGDRETLRLFSIAARSLLPVTPPIVLPGSLTALWTMPDGARVLAVSRHAATGRYEAFEVSVVCGR